MIGDDKKITMIDFPQMVSTRHYNADFYFERDVQCIHTFFSRRYKYESDFTLDFKEIIKDRIKDLDTEVKASGFVKKNMGDNVSDLEILDEYEKLKNDIGSGDEEGEDYEGEEEGQD